MVTISSAPERIQTDTSVSYPRLVHWYASGASGGRRSFAATANAFHVDESTLRAQAKAGCWVERAAICDARLLERELASGLNVQRRSVVQQVAIGERINRLLEAALAKLEEVEGDAAVDQINASLDLVKAAQRAQDLMRKAMNMPTSVTRNEIAVAMFDAGSKATRDYSVLSDAELRLTEVLEVIERLITGTPREQLSQAERTLLDKVNGTIEVQSWR